MLPLPALEAAPEFTAAPVESDAWSDRVVRGVPWWAISAGVHFAILLLFALIILESQSRQPDLPVVLHTTPPPKPPPDFTKPVLNPSVVRKDNKPNNAPLVEVPPSDEKWESEDDDPHREFKGAEGPDLSTLKMTESTHVTVIGVGGGGARPFGGPFGGRFHRIGGPPGGDGPGPKEVNATIDALLWLARHQASDGRWDTDGFASECGKRAAGSCAGPGYPEFDAGNTGLALLAFLGAGYTHVSRDTYEGVCFGTVVKKGLQWLMANQDAEGCLGGRGASKFMYNHAIAALALAEGYGMTGSAMLREPAQRGIDFLIAAQNPYKAWRYTARPGDNDTSVTGWGVMALKSAEISGLSVSRGAYEGARAWLDEATGGDSRCGYTHKDTGQVVVAGRNEHYGNHEALTAAAVLSRIFIDKNRSDSRLREGAAHLAKDLPRFENKGNAEGNPTDFYYWYYGSLALFQYDGPGGPLWNAWYKALTASLLPAQQSRKDTCLHGSWDPVDRWGFEGGRVYATAINALTLEVYYRYDNVFGAGRGK